MQEESFAATAAEGMRTGEMNRLNTLSSAFNIRPGEGRITALLLLHTFLLGAAYNFTQAAAFSLFLTQFDAQSLPLVYIATAAVTILIALLYLRLGERLSFSRLLIVNLGFLLLAVGGFYLGLALTDARWLVFALPILFQVMVNLGDIEFWSLAGRLFNVRQGKRLFGLVGAGPWLAIVITGFLIPPLVSLLGTANLLLLAAGGMAGALGVLIYITHSLADRLATPAAGAPTEWQRGFTDVLKNRYVILTLVLVILVWAEFFFLENIFYARSAAQYPAEEQLASFLGIFLAALGIVTLLLNAFLAGPVISRYGLRVGLLVLPLMLVVGVTAMAVTGTFAGATAFLFWLTVVIKLLDTSLGASIDRSALKILYQPLPANQRRQLQTIAEGIFLPLAHGLAGVALLSLNTLFASGTVELTYALLVIVLIWTTVSILLGREYPAMLVRALSKRRLSDADVSLTDGLTLAILQQGLESPHPGAVIYAVNMLEAMEHESLTASLQGLLTHPAPEVRQDALTRIERLDLVTALPTVRELVAREPAPAVRATALRTLIALGEDEEFETVAAYLEDPDPLLRRGAMVGLLQSGGIEGVLAAGHRLLQMVSAQDPTDRALAAEVLGEVGVRKYSQPLLSLLQDGDPQVQRAALRSAGRLKNPEFWPLVVERLRARQVQGAAVAALVAGGDSVLPELKAAFGKYQQEQGGLGRLAQVCGRIGGTEAVALLIDRLDIPDPTVRTQVLHALSRCGFRAKEDTLAAVRRQIRVEAAEAALTLAALVDIGEGDALKDDADAREAVSLLQTALTDVFDQHRMRLCYLLSFVYDARSILRARDHLSHPSPEKRAYALEVIDISISPEFKTFALPLLRDLTPSQRLQHLTSVFPQPRLDRIRRLKEIVVGGDQRLNAWTRACALHLMGLLSTEEAAGTAISVLSGHDPLMRETAAWTLARLDGTKHQGYLNPLRQDPSPHVARVVQWLETTRNGEELMLSTIEKVIILKTVSIFDQTADDILAGVALLLEEVEFPAGETIFEKGDVGDCMYIIVDGEVRVHDGAHTLSHLRDRDVFGEMALLDAEPRVASVTPVSDTRLLRLDQEPFYELMADQTEVARGIIQVLSGRLRAADRDLNALQERVQALNQRQLSASSEPRAMQD